MTECILKALNYADYELCHWCFSRNFPKVFRAAILKELYFIKTLFPYFIEEHLWMSASDEATPKKIFGRKSSSKLTLKINGTTVMVAAMIFKIVSNLRSVSPSVTWNVCYRYNTWVTGVTNKFDRNCGGKTSQRKWLFESNL